MRTPVRPLAVLAALGGLVILSGCTSAAAASWQDAGTKPPASATSPVSVTAPADSAKDVSTATEIAFTAPKGGAATVTLTDAAGATVPGALRADGSAWVPAKQLSYGTAYTAT